MPWRVEFYVGADKRAPVEEFLEHLPADRRAKLVAVVHLLAREGPSLPFPYSSQVSGRLRELRTQHGKEKLRIFYFADTNRTFVLLHAFIKRTAKAPAEDIDIAAGRMRIHEVRVERSKR